MKIEYIKKDPSHTRLILIMAGWSAGPEVGKNISMPGWDVAVMHDFTELAVDTTEFDGYYTIYLFAWSLGVYAASRLLPAERITAAFAINGTLMPVDDRNGIPETIFEGTRDNLDASNLMKFRLRMTGDRETARALTEEGQSEIDSLKCQLSVIRNDYKNHRTVNKSLPWVRAFISKGDRIFPPENQKNFWTEQEDVEIIEVPGQHYIRFEEIVSSVIANTETVSKKFRKASMTYDTQAIAQYSAAIKLARLLKDYKGENDNKLLEIGSGTGLFTKEYSRYIRPEEAVFVDITPTGPFGIAKEEQYITADAERWIETCRDQFDIIVSASAIQWFADLPRFLHLCCERLNEGGCIAMSTFLPGNMKELDSLRPSPLKYHGEKKLREWLMRDFDDVRVIGDEIKVEFKSVREMLLHLKHTGVGGSAPASGNSITDMRHLTSLTYLPVYLLGRKRNHRN